MANTTKFPGAGQLQVVTKYGLEFRGHGVTPAQDTTVLPGAGTLAVASAAPSAEIIHFKVVSVQALVLTGVAPVRVVGTNHIRGPPIVSLALTGAAPSVEIEHNKTPAVVSLALSSTAPSPGYTRNPSAVALALGGAASSAEIEHIRATPAGSLALTGTVPIAGDWTVAIPVGKLQVVTRYGLEICGHAPVVVVVPTATAPTVGSLSLTGQTPSTDRFVDPLVGVITLTGELPSILQPTIAVTPGAGSLLFKSDTGLDAGALTFASTAPQLGLTTKRPPQLQACS